LVDPIKKTGIICDNIGIKYKDSTFWPAPRNT
jgi:hypothetical protein